MLVKSKETYEFDDEATAVAFIENNKNADDFQLTKYTMQRKVYKRTGDVIFIVVLEKEFN